MSQEQDGQEQEEYRDVQGGEEVQDILEQLTEELQDLKGEHQSMQLDQAEWMQISEILGPLGWEAAWVYRSKLKERERQMECERQLEECERQLEECKFEVERCKFEVEAQNELIEAYRGAVDAWKKETRELKQRYHTATQKGHHIE